MCDKLGFVAQNISAKGHAIGLIPRLGNSFDRKFCIAQGDLGTKEALRKPIGRSIRCEDIIANCRESRVSRYLYRKERLGNRE